DRPGRELRRDRQDQRQRGRALHPRAARRGGPGPPRRARRRRQRDGDGGGATDVEITKTATGAVSYAINRAWNANCTIAHETRDVTALVAYSYTANVIRCATQSHWHHAPGAQGAR